MSDQEIPAKVQRGGRFVVFQWCVSVIVMTFKRGLDVYFIPAGGLAVSKGLPYTLLTLVAGWWGIPWGPLYSIQSLFRDFTGRTVIRIVAIQADITTLDVNAIVNTVNSGPLDGGGVTDKAVLLTMCYRSPQRRAIAHRFKLYSCRHNVQPKRQTLKTISANLCSAA